jgi:hypothetical protein
VNGAGFAHFIVGAAHAGGGIGQAYIFFGGASPNSVADVTLNGVASGDQFGFTVSGAGDINHDGFADVIVGAPFNATGGASAGQAYIFLGGQTPDNVADVTMTGLAAGDNLGHSAGAGDVNDGLADVIVGAPLNDAPATTRARPTSTSRASERYRRSDISGRAGRQFRLQCGRGGRRERDGFADVIVGAPLYGPSASSQGQASVFFGGRSPDKVADFVMTGGAGDQLGWTVAGAGDVNGDGFADVIVGAPLHDFPVTDAGEALVFLGGTTPSNTPAFSETESVASTSWAGRSRAPET